MAAMLISEMRPIRQLMYEFETLNGKKKFHIMCNFNEIFW